MDTYKRMGEILLEHSLISQDQLDHALAARERTHIRFGEVAVILGITDEESITKCLSEQFDMPIADLDRVQPKGAALTRVSPFFSLTRLFLPLEVNGDTLTAVVADPLDVRTCDQVSKETGLRLSLYLASPRALSAAIARYYEMPNIKGAA